MPTVKSFKANVSTRKVSIEILYDGQFTLSSQLIIRNYPILPQRKVFILGTPTTHRWKYFKEKGLSICFWFPKRQCLYWVPSRFNPQFFYEEQSPIWSQRCSLEIETWLCSEKLFEKRVFFNSFHLNSRKIKNKVILRNSLYEFYFV